MNLKPTNMNLKPTNMNLKLTNMNLKPTNMNYGYRSVCQDSPLRVRVQDRDRVWLRVSVRARESCTVDGNGRFLALIILISVDFGNGRILFILP